MANFIYEWLLTQEETSEFETFLKMNENEIEPIRKMEETREKCGNSLRITAKIEKIKHQSSKMKTSSIDVTNSKKFRDFKFFLSKNSFFKTFWTRF